MHKEEQVKRALIACALLIVIIPAAADALRQRIEEQLHWTCQVPDYQEHVALTPPKRR